MFISVIFSSLMQSFADIIVCIRDVFSLQAFAFLYLCIFVLILKCNSGSFSNRDRQGRPTFPLILNRQMNTKIYNIYIEIYVSDKDKLLKYTL